MSKKYVISNPYDENYIHHHYFPSFLIQSSEARAKVRFGHIENTLEVNLDSHENQSTACYLFTNLGIFLLWLLLALSMVSTVVVTTIGTLVSNLVELGLVAFIGFSGSDTLMILQGFLVTRTCQLRYCCHCQ